MWSHPLHCFKVETLCLDCRLKMEKTSATLAEVREKLRELNEKVKRAQKVGERREFTFPPLSSSGGSE
jgi:hypothetical protein